MDYLKHYNVLMDRAKGRSLTGYGERHHIVPRCIGGTNEPSNFVLLTPEEHYVAHQLLVKMHPGNRSLLWAASAMTGKSAKQASRNNKLYGWLRRRLAEDSSRRWKGRVFSEETRAKMSAARKGIKRGPFSEEHKAKIAAAHKGKVKSPEHIAKIAASKTGKKRGPHSELHRQRQSASIKEALKNVDRSWMQSAEYKEQRKAQMREVWEKRRQGIIPSPKYSGE